ncbi:Tellurite resistance TerB [Brevibacillus laterosporus]|uniref:Tellurite resistance TerB n=1 Tax=Brevibacillus laterosporus TaxID=1465 RepID=A0A502HDZ9_BRELA|nr:Tellurite resistance TerB [Brevibacillus laterosporus]TPG71656.1 Tellurite resistance TerB [Brevibacillus laterosporus]TPG77110.1 Tellurite resistance TerB [Brevibacillus laterosporus]
MVNSVKGWFQQQGTTLGEAVKKFKNKNFLEAIAAGCALVAAADGKIESSEKQKMVGYISRNDELKVFKVSEVIDVFNKHTENFEFDHMVGKMEALKVIGAFKNNPEVARVIVSVCCAIGAADGDFDQQEKEVVREICQALNLNSADFQL